MGEEKKVCYRIVHTKGGYQRHTKRGMDRECKREKEGGQLYGGKQSEPELTEDRRKTGHRT
jgi:hypothetical protein